MAAGLARLRVTADLDPATELLRCSGWRSRRAGSELCPL
jgi:hypothetical protein